MRMLNIGFEDIQDGLPSAASLTLTKFQHYPTLEPDLEVFIATYVRRCLPEPLETSATQPRRSSNITQDPEHEQLLVHTKR